MSEEDTESERKETVWQCEGCLKTFHSARETNEHEMSCKTYMHLYPEKQTSSFRNQSIVKYPALRIFVKLYTILGFLISSFLIHFNYLLYIIYPNNTI